MFLLLQAWWQPVLAPVLTALGVALAGLLSTLIFKITSWVNKKLGNEKIADAIERVAEVADVAVKIINQSFVDQMKKDGLFDKDSQKRALKEALQISKELISEEVIEIIKDNFGDFEKYLIGIIEKTVADLKL